MYRRPLCHPQGELFITSNPSAYCKVVALVELQSMKCIVYGVFLESCLQLLKQYCFVVMA